MNSMIVAVLLVFLAIAVISMVTSMTLALKKIFYIGVSIWSRWLPVLASIIYLTILGSNLIVGGNFGGNILNLSGFLSIPEIVVLFLVGPMFLTRVGNVLALATVLYCTQRLLFGEAEGASLSMLLMIGSAMIIAVLNDRMPWIASGGLDPAAIKLREIISMTLSVGSMVVIIVTILKIYAFAKWMKLTLGVGISPAVALAGLVLMCVGWLSVAAGFTRHMTLPLLCLPTLFALAFLTGWPSYLMVIPFSAAVALSLATAERRAPSVRAHTLGGWIPTF